jgi:methylase of polypeptide subunit release factors
MKSFLLPWLCVSAVLMLVAVSCGRKEARADATQALQESFKAAEPQVRKAIEVVNARLQAKDYTAAARALAPVVMQQRLTEPERQAVGVALEQINQAIAADRSLNTKEMYELRAKMFHAVHNSGSRF